jgi:hypothetical protein
MASLPWDGACGTCGTWNNEWLPYWWYFVCVHMWYCTHHDFLMLYNETYRAIVGKPFIIPCSAHCFVQRALFCAARIVLCSAHCFVYRMYRMSHPMVGKPFIIPCPAHHSVPHMYHPIARNPYILPSGSYILC